MTIAALTTEQAYDLSHALANASKALGNYLGESENPARVVEVTPALVALDAALAPAVAA